MTQFSKDVDLLKWEPVLFRDLALVSQRLCSGSDGELDGTTFESAGASFTNAAVAAGHVIYLNDGASLDGCYEVVSVDSATQLTISVVRAGSDDTTVPPPDGSEINYHVSTFDPQAQEVAYSLLQYFGINPSGASEGVTPEEIQDEGVLRQASVFAVLSAIFTSSAAAEDGRDIFWRKSLHYQQLFQTARVKIRIGIDSDNDEIAEQFRTGGTVRLRRY